MNDKYILDGTNPVPCDDMLQWGLWFQTADRRVAQDQLPDGVIVSTVFLGLDHRFVGDGPPLLFETMIFGGQHDGYQDRYATWTEAECGHRLALTIAQAASGGSGKSSGGVG